MDRRTGSPAEAEAWLPDGAGRRPGKPKPPGSGSARKPEDWLPADARPRPQHQALVALPGLGPGGGDEQPDGDLPPSAEKRATPDLDLLGDLELLLRRLERVIAQQTERIERQQEAITRLAAAKPDLSVEGEPNPSWPGTGSFDPNAVGAAELIRIGLSRTQAARFVARREQLGTYRSVEDFDELRGFPAVLREKLKGSARISA